MPVSVGDKLGPYEILAPIGAGGMGEVYCALDGRLNRKVAVKILPRAFADDPDRLRRFRQEAEAIGSLNHPNVLRCQLPVIRLCEIRAFRSVDQTNDLGLPQMPRGTGLNLCAR